MFWEHPRKWLWICVYALRESTYSKVPLRHEHRHSSKEKPLSSDIRAFKKDPLCCTRRTISFGSREARARCSGWGRKSESATRHDTADTARHPSLLIWNLTISDEIPNLKMNNFRRKLVKSGRTPYLKSDNFRRNFVKIREIEAHSFFEN